MVTQVAFWDKIARKYAAKPVDDVEAYEDTLTRTRAYLDGDDRVLELGCGTGTTAIKLAGDVRHIIATDVSGEMIAIANEKIAAAAVGNIEAVQAGVAETGTQDALFDTVLAFNLLHLLPELPPALGQIRNRLKPGGIFVSKSGCLAEAPIWIRLALPVMRLIGKAPHVLSFSARQLDAMVVEAGFEILETKTYPGIAPTRLIIARRL